MGMRTPLYHAHLLAGAKLVDFSGWDMPLHYGSQVGEHHAVRSDAGVFDVSHMTVIDVTGPDAMDYLDRLLANNIRKLTQPGQAMYSAMLNEDGGILDDLIVYRGVDEPVAAYLVVVNCATRGKDLTWMQQQAHGFACEVIERGDYAILAVQGPGAMVKTQGELTGPRRALATRLKRFQGAWADGWFIARTGYTGEPGYEIILPAKDAPGFWAQLIAAPVTPVGLGARDTLRLEAGMNLYGNDMDETVTPLESNMASTTVLFVDGDSVDAAAARDFIGSTALRARLKAGQARQLVGLVMPGRGVLRAHYPVFCDGVQVGEITSGAFSPTLQHAIALARVTRCSAQMAVEIRGRMHQVNCVTTPFVRNGKRVYSPVTESATESTTDQL